MKIKLFISIIVLTRFVPGFGQNNNCVKLDSNSCFVKVNYPSSNIHIEKKVESRDTIHAFQTALIADMDNDCIPELLVIGINANNINVIDSKTGKTKWQISTPYIDERLNGIALADIDNDGRPELFFEASITEPTNAVGRLLCYYADGKLAWVSDQSYNKYSQFKDRFGGTPALADFNQDGIPEIYVNNKIFNAQTGIKLADGGAYGIGTGRATNFFSDALTIAAQLDEDPTDLELAAGYTVYKVKITNPNGTNGNSMTPITIQIDNEYKDGYTSVSDINLDGLLDVIITTPGFNNEALLYAYTILNGKAELIAKTHPPGIFYTGAGPACIGDINGLGTLSILLTRFSKLLAYSYNGSDQFQLDWTFTTTDSSGFTGLTMFDLNADGVQEIIYRDETHLSIIDGSKKSARLITKIPCFSWTWAEYPVIGDLDNTGHSKICIPCSIKEDVRLAKLTIYGPPDSLPGWAPARGIWNQYAYNPLFINDDLTVPAKPRNPATYENGRYNNFMQQASLLDSNGMYKVAASSLRGKINCVHYDVLTKEYSVSFNVFNHSNASSSAETNLPVSFYDGDPEQAGNLLGIFYTQSPLEPGDSLVDQSFSIKVSQINDLYMVVNTKRGSTGLFDPKDFVALECDYTDNIYHTTDLPQIEKRNATICSGSEFQFFDSLLNVEGRYVHTSTNGNGCDSLITILELSVLDTVHTSQSLTACDSLHWNSKVYHESGSFVDRFQSSNGCDSVVTLNLNIRYSSDTLVRATGCRKFDFNDKVYTEDGKYFINLRNKQGCDSTIELHLNIIALDTNITKLGNTLIALDSVASYQWIDCNDQFAVIPGAIQKSYTPDKDGTYAVILNNPPCLDTTLCLTVLISNTKDEKSRSIDVYPNPVSKTLYIKTLDSKSSPLYITIRDIHGRSVINKVLPLAETENTIKLNVSELVGGLYYLIIKSRFNTYPFVFSKI